MPNWNEIVEGHAERIFRIAYRILGSVHDAEDVSQVVFAEAFRIFESREVQSWPGLFTRLSTVRSIDLVRRRKNTVAIADNDRVSNLEPYDNAVGSELADWLRRVVAELPQQQMEIFTLTHFEQLDRNEVAQILGVSPESVSTALYKARQRLTHQLDTFNGVQGS